MDDYDFWREIITDKSGNVIKGRALDEADIKRFQGNEDIEYTETEEDWAEGDKNMEVNNDGIIGFLNLNLYGNSQISTAGLYTDSERGKNNIQDNMANDNEFFGGRTDSSEDIYHYGYDIEMEETVDYMGFGKSIIYTGREILFDDSGYIIYETFINAED